MRKIALLAVLAIAACTKTEVNVGTGPTVPSQPPSADTTQQLPTVTEVDVRSRATSVHAPEHTQRGTLRYGPTLSIDGSRATAWCEGAPGFGTDVRITWNFSQPVDLRRIEFINGYGEDGRRYLRNNRIRSGVLTLGSDRQGVVLNDQFGPQTVDASYRNVRAVSLTIESVYRGTVYNDTCLTEVRFLGPAGPLP